MKDFTILREERLDVQIIHLSGSLDMYSFPRLRVALEASLLVNPPRIILELAEIDYIGSAGLSKLVEMSKTARDKGGDIKLCGLPERIFKIIELLGYNKPLSCYRTLDEAWHNFGINLDGLSH